MDDTFAKPVSNLKYIDRIVPVPLLLKGLYTNEVILNRGTNCFIYFQDNDAFLTIYDQQEFIYTKALKYSFEEMHERFCELLGEQIEKDLFIQFLANEGLSTHNSEHQKYLIKLFGELFLHINDVLTYAKRAYEIEKIESVYIGSQVGSIIGLDEYCQTYLSLESLAFDFDYGYETGDRYVDQIQQLMHLYTQTQQDLRYDVNFTLYHRPPPFLQRHSGKVIAVTLVSLMAAFAYPATYWTLSYGESLHKQLMEQEYIQVHNTKVTRKKLIDLKLANKAEAEAHFKMEIDAFNEKKATLIKIRDIKVHYPMKGKILTALTKDLNRFKVELSNVSYTENNTSKIMTMRVMAPKDKQITDLIAYMTKNRSKDFSYNIEKIFLDEESKHYRGDLKVVLK